MNQVIRPTSVTADQSIRREIGVPIQMWRKTMDSFVPRNASQEDARQACREFIAGFGERIDPYSAVVGRGLLLGGPCNSGKTLLACTALYEVRRLSAGRHTARFISATKYVGTGLHLLRNTFDEIAAARIREVTNATLLVLDDLGAEHRGATGYGEDLLGELIRTRFYEGRPTIITTNLNRKKMAEVYSERMASLLVREAVDVVPLFSQEG